MADLDIPKPPTRGIKLVLVGTTFPAQFLPASLIFPTWSTVSVGDTSVSVEVKVRDARNELQETDNPDVPTQTLELVKANLLSITTGEKWTIGRKTYPGATLAIRDPLGVEDSFGLTFLSLDANNPTYLLKLLAKMLSDRLGIQVHQAFDADDIPF